MKLLKLKPVGIYSLALFTGLVASRLRSDNISAHHMSPQDDLS